MRRGTRVGQAYIALTADGSGINNDIEDSLDDVDFAEIGNRKGQDLEDGLRPHLDAMEQNFREAGQRMGESFDKDNNIGESISRRLAASFNDGDFDALIREVGRRSGTEFGGQFSEQFDAELRSSVFESVERNIREAARRNKVEFSDMFSSVGDEDGPRVSLPSPLLDSITGQAETQYRAQVQALETRVQADREAVWRMGFDRHAEFEREFTAALEDEERLRLAVEERAQSDREAVWRMGFERQEDRERESARVYQALLDGEQATLARSLAERAQLEEDDNRRSERTRAQREQMYSEMFDNIDEEARRSNIRQAAYAAEHDRMLERAAQREEERQARSLRGRIAAQRASRNESGGIGNLFGEGSRNNFLNLIGKSIGNVTGLLGTAKNAVTGLASTFQEGFQGAAAGASGLTRTGAGLSAVITEIGATAIVSLPAIAVGALVAVAAMSVLVSVASALLAILVAMSATILSALTGALLVGAGALGAMAVAGGLVAVAFTSMDDAQKKALAADFAPLKQELTGLGQLMFTQIIPYFDTWSSNLQTALYQLAPLASTFGDAIGRSGSVLTEALSGPGFALLTQQLGVYLPGIITRLSYALGGFLNGIAGTFAAILPQVSTFSAWLVGIATRFSNFVNTAEGQNKIKDFLDRAVTSLVSFSGFVREATGFVTDLLFNVNSQNAGNSIFDSLRDSFAGFREGLKGDDLKNWFDRALEFGGQVKDLIISIKDTIKRLDSDGTLDKVGAAFSSLADTLDTVGRYAGAAVGLVEDLVNIIFNPARFGESLWNKLTGDSDAYNASLTNGINLSNVLASTAANFGGSGALPGGGGPKTPIGELPVQGPGLNANGTQSTPTIPTQSDLINSGLDTLNATSVSNGGYKPDPVKKTPKAPKYKNPYVAMANAIIAQAPSVAQIMADAVKAMNKQVADAINEAEKADTADAVKSSFSSLVESIKTSAASAVETAQSSLTSAAQSLASATSARAAKQALAKVKRARKELKAELAQQKKVQDAAAILNAQKVVTGSNVEALLNGLTVQNATLADYAEAREKLTAKLEAANSALETAIQMRDAYRVQVADSIKAFGALVTTQAKVINGVEQALTATDITTNLQTRLDQIRKFQSDLRILLAQGLSNAAYQQIVDAGVEQGGALAQALITGGAGAISQTNGLVDQINDIANSLGIETSSQMYQAGVDAAQGLVDGLNSLSAELNSAATALGTTIANAVKAALGIASPSKVMKGVTRNVGQTLIDGLDAEGNEVERSAYRLSSRIRIAPSIEVARYTADQARRDSAGVSENPAPLIGEVNIHTPTEDPKAVAHESINEIVGRLG